MTAPLADASFGGLIASRRAWIDEVLRPWCRQAPRRELLQAEQDWTDLAGRADPAQTLWLWAWSRFPVLCVEGLAGIDETYEVIVKLRDGTEHQGYPDARASQRGRLVLAGSNAEPLSIDDIVTVERALGVR